MIDGNLSMANKFTDLKDEPSELNTERGNKIIRIGNRENHDPVKIEGYYVFSDNWILYDTKQIRNQQGEIFNVLDCQFITETHQPIMSYAELKRVTKKKMRKETKTIHTCLKLDKPANINDTFYCIYESLQNRNNCKLCGTTKYEKDIIYPDGSYECKHCTFEIKSLDKTPNSYKRNDDSYGYIDKYGQYDKYGNKL